MHYLRSHHQEATDIYKRLLLENREDLALNVYVAMCYYKLDYYDVSLEILAVYLQAFPDSQIGVNLKVGAASVLCVALCVLKRSNGDGTRCRLATTSDYTMARLLRRS